MTILLFFSISSSICFSSLIKLFSIFIFILLSYLLNLVIKSFKSIISFSFNNNVSNFGQSELRINSREERLLQDKSNNLKLLSSILDILSIESSSKTPFDNINSSILFNSTLLLSKNFLFLNKLELISKDFNFGKTLILLKIA